MKWELGALKILAKNPTVPGIALQDTIGEIERLTRKIEILKIDLRDMGTLRQNAVDAQEAYRKESDSVVCALGEVLKIADEYYAFGLGGFENEYRHAKVVFEARKTRVAK